MKKLVVSWLGIGLYIFSFVVVGTLFSYGHFVGGTILLAFIIIVLFLVEETAASNYIHRELEWISRCVMDEHECKELRESRTLYYIIRSLLSDKKILKGMDIKKIAKLILECIKTEEVERGIKTKFLENIDLIEGNKKNKSGEYELVYSNYGFSIPTPKIILKIKDGKLAKIKK